MESMAGADGSCPAQVEANENTIGAIPVVREEAHAVALSIVGCNKVEVATANSKEEREAEEEVMRFYRGEAASPSEETPSPDQSSSPPKLDLGPPALTGEVVAFGIEEEEHHDGDVEDVKALAAVEEEEDEEDEDMKALAVEEEEDEEDEEDELEEEPKKQEEHCQEGGDHAAETQGGLTSTSVPANGPEPPIPSLSATAAAEAEVEHAIDESDTAVVGESDLQTTDEGPGKACEVGEAEPPGIQEWSFIEQTGLTASMMESEERVAIGSNQILVDYDSQAILLDRESKIDGHDVREEGEHVWAEERERPADVMMVDEDQSQVYEQQAEKDRSAIAVGEDALPSAGESRTIVEGIGATGKATCDTQAAGDEEEMEIAATGEETCTAKVEEEEEEEEDDDVEVAIEGEGEEDVEEVDWEMVSVEDTIASRSPEIARKDQVGNQTGVEEMAREESSFVTIGLVLSSVGDREESRMVEEEREITNISEQVKWTDLEEAIECRQEDGERGAEDMECEVGHAQTEHAESVGTQVTTGSHLDNASAAIGASIEVGNHVREGWGMEEQNDEAREDEQDEEDEEEEDDIDEAVHMLPPEEPDADRFDQDGVESVDADIGEIGVGNESELDQSYQALSTRDVAVQADETEGAGFVSEGPSAGGWSNGILSEGAPVGSPSDSLSERTVSSSEDFDLGSIVASSPVLEAVAQSTQTYDHLGDGAGTTLSCMTAARILYHMAEQKGQVQPEDNVSSNIPACTDAESNTSLPLRPDTLASSSQVGELLAGDLKITPPSVIAAVENVGSVGLESTVRDTDDVLVDNSVPMDFSQVDGLHAAVSVGVVAGVLAERGVGDQGVLASTNEADADDKKSFERRDDDGDASRKSGIGQPEMGQSPSSDLKGAEDFLCMSEQASAALSLEAAEDGEEVGPQPHDQEEEDQQEEEDDDDDSDVVDDDEEEEEVAFPPAYVHVVGAEREELAMETQSSSPRVAYRMDRSLVRMYGEGRRQRGRGFIREEDDDAESEEVVFELRDDEIEDIIYEDADFKHDSEEGTSGGETEAEGEMDDEEDEDGDEEVVLPPVFRQPDMVEIEEELEASSSFEELQKLLLKAARERIQYQYHNGRQAVRRVDDEKVVIRSGNRSGERGSMSEPEIQVASVSSWGKQLHDEDNAVASTSNLVQGRGEYDADSHAHRGSAPSPVDINPRIPADRYLEPIPICFDSPSTNVPDDLTLPSAAKAGRERHRDSIGDGSFIKSTIVQEELWSPSRWRERGGQGLLYAYEGLLEAKSSGQQRFQQALDGLRARRRKSGEGLSGEREGSVGEDGNEVRSTVPEQWKAVSPAAWKDKATQGVQYAYVGLTEARARGGQKLSEALEALRARASAAVSPAVSKGTGTKGAAGDASVPADDILDSDKSGATFKVKSACPYSGFKVERVLDVGGARSKGAGAGASEKPGRNREGEQTVFHTLSKDCKTVCSRSWQRVSTWTDTILKRKATTNRSERELSAPTSSSSSAPSDSAEAREGSGMAAAMFALFVFIVGMLFAVIMPVLYRLPVGRATAMPASKIQDSNLFMPIKQPAGSGDFHNEAW